MYSIAKSLAVFYLLFSFSNLNAQLFQNAQSAAFAIGATSPNSGGSLGTSAQKFTAPVAQSCYAIDAKHNCIWVADYFGNRVLRYSYPITSNFPTANLVLGQINFSGCNYGGATAASIGNPQGIAVDTITGNLFVLCISQNRILRFNAAHAIAVNNTMATAVLGQVHFGTTSSGASQTQLNLDQTPACGNLLHYDQLSGALWVSDNNNARVLRYDRANTLSIGAAASAVLGQSTFTNSSPALTDSNFSRPDGLTTIGNSLFVSDPINHRILRFDNVYSKANGAPADAVFGQSSFSTSVSGTAANRLHTPSDLSSSNSQLLVADAGNSRVLIFDNPLNSTLASHVLLAPSLSVSGSGIASATTAAANYNLEFDASKGQLLVQDRQNSRVLVFQSCPVATINGPSQVCSGNSVTLATSAANTITWSTGQTGSSIVLTPLSTSTYTAYSVFLSPTYSCASTTVKTISVFPRPTISTSSGTICEGASFTLAPSGAATYSFQGGSAIVSPSTNTSYTCRGYSTEGCLSLNTVMCMITVNRNPSVSISLLPQQTCLNGAPVQVNFSPSGGAILGYPVSNGTLNPNLVGDFSITYTYTDAATGCSASDTAALKVESCTGIKQRSKSSDVFVYPNPTRNSITVDFGMYQSEEIIVSDVLGSVLISEKLNKNQTTYSIDLRPYSNGIYIVSVKSNTDLKTIKVIKE